VESLLVLALLACPVGMGAMMWWMGRNMKHQQAAPAATDGVEELRAEEARLTAEIDQLRSERAARAAQEPS
jgi:cell division protein FtsB